MPLRTRSRIGLGRSGDDTYFPPILRLPGLDPGRCFSCQRSGERQHRPGSRPGRRISESLPMLKIHLLAFVALALAAPASADDDISPDLAESRLRGCLLAGASGTGQSQLEAAVIQTRAYCGAQINRVQRQRVAAATAGLKGNEAEAAKTRAIRALNAEIAQAV